MHTAAALTVRPPRPGWPASWGRAADCRGDAYLGRRETRSQAAADWGTSMTPVQWYLTTRLCANSIPLLPRGHETAVESPRRSLADAGPRR